MHGNDRTGLFRPPPIQQTAQQRTALTLIATAALALSTMIAVTVVSIGIARAEMLGAANSEDGLLAVAMLLGVIFAGMGGIAAVTAFYNSRRSHRD